VRRIRPLATALLVAALVVPGGCGFIRASNVSHTKPNGFVLRGHVAVPLPAGDARASGAGCAAPASLADIAAGVPVKVMDPGGREIAAGTLSSGVVARASAAPSPTCDFPFEIRAVPGGVDSYGISVAGRPAQIFPAMALREDQAAVITLAP
jgi:hypothetical protein